MTALPIKIQSRLKLERLLPLLFVTGLWVALQSPPHPPSSCCPPELTVQKTYGQLPLAFEPNQGQAPPFVKYLARGGGYTLMLTKQGAVLALSQTSFPQKGKPHRPERREPAFLKFDLAGGLPDPHFKAEGKLPGTSNYFIGRDPSQWRTQIPQYAKVRVEGVYPGIDMVYYGNGGKLEYDFVLAPGADPGAIALRFQGGKAKSLKGNGGLVITSGDQEISFKAPVVYQMGGREGKPLEGRFALRGNRRVGFEVEGYDPSLPLVIDPILDYSTYFGASSGANIQWLAVDASGDAYVAGSVQNPGFPTTSGAPQTVLTGAENAFVAKLNASGTALLYSTYLGGSSTDIAESIAVDANGNAYVTGGAFSANFPITPGAAQTVNGGDLDGYVTEINPTGTGLVYSTFLGGTLSDQGNGIAVDQNGNAYVTGVTDSANFPTTSGVYQTTIGSNDDAFVAKIAAGGASLVYSTFLGGNNYDYGFAIAVDGGGNAYVTGEAESTNFPTTSGAPQSVLKGSYDGFITKMSPLGRLIYSTYMGGLGQGNDIQVDGQGDAFVVGSFEGGYPTTTFAYKRSIASVSNPLVVELNPSGTAFVYATYLGGSSTDEGSRIALDGAGDAYVTGYTSSNDFPTTTGAFQTAIPGIYNAFLSELNPSGSGLVYSTYLGGNKDDYGYGVARDALGGVYVGGGTSSANFPTTSGALQTSMGGSSGSFITKFDPSLFPTPTPTATDSPTATLTFTPTLSPTPKAFPTIAPGCGPVGYTVPNSGDFGDIGTSTRAYVERVSFPSAFAVTAISLFDSHSPSFANNYLAGLYGDDGTGSYPTTVLTYAACHDPGDGNPQTIALASPVSLSAGYGWLVLSCYSSSVTSIFFSTYSPQNGGFFNGQIPSPSGGSSNFLARSYGPAMAALGCPVALPGGTPTPPAPGAKPYVFPNPASGASVQFVYSMREGGNAKIKVYNALAEVVSSLDDPKPSGVQSSTLNIQSFAPGHYFYQVVLDYGVDGQDRFDPQILVVKK